MTRAHAIGMRAVAAFAAIALVGVLCGFGVAAGSASAAAKEPYRVNDLGQTYGSMLNDETGEMNPVAPDLVFCEATNGAAGYYLRADLDRVSAELAAQRSTDEGIARELDAHARAVVEAAADVCGLAISESDAKAFLAGYTPGMADDDVRGALESEGFAGAALNEDSALAVYRAAQEATAIPINVYDCDGETVVGQYLIVTM